MATNELRTSQNHRWGPPGKLGTRDPSGRRGSHSPAWAEFVETQARGGAPFRGPAWHQRATPLQEQGGVLGDLTSGRRRRAPRGRAGDRGGAGCLALTGPRGPGARPRVGGPAPRPPSLRVLAAALTPRGRGEQLPGRAGAAGRGRPGQGRASPRRTPEGERAPGARGARPRPPPSLRLRRTDFATRSAGPSRSRPGRGHRGAALLPGSSGRPGTGRPSPASRGPCLAKGAARCGAPAPPGRRSRCGSRAGSPGGGGGPGVLQALSALGWGRGPLEFSPLLSLPRRRPCVWVRSSSAVDLRQFPR